MQLSSLFSPLADVAADWLVVPLWEEPDLAGAPAALDDRLDGLLGRLQQAGDITGKAKELTPLLDPPGIAADRVMVVGLGKRQSAGRPGLTDAAAAAARAITGKQRARVALAIPEDVPGLSYGDAALAIGVGAVQGSYGPGLLKSEPARFAPREIVCVAPPSAPQDDVRRAVRRAEVEGEAVRLARELVNLPPSDLYPERFADRARETAQRCGVELVVFDEKRLEEERMGALLAVGRGSDRPPRLVVLRYVHGGSRPTLGLVGKGVTFDSGGLSLKASESMEDMKCDMAGAAAVLGAVQAIAGLQIPVNVIGVLAVVENMPSGRAMKLGDVLRTRAGKTIEVLNTDAEGRLILADALAYAVDSGANHLVDVATLTGACMVALGTEVAGLMGNDNGWVQRVLAAADRAGEKVWQLPLFPHYGELIKSDVADMKNTGGTRYGGAITAAKLLEEFVGGVPWAHLDIAGPAWAERESATRDAGGTGCFVRTLTALAEQYSDGAPQPA